MTTLIILNIPVGGDAGPFNLYSNTDGYTTPFATGISAAALTAGYTSTVVPDGTTIIRVVSTGLCTNYIDVTINLIPTTTTTSSTSTSSTTTTSTTAVPTTTTTSSSSTSTSTSTSTTTATPTTTTTSSSTSTSTTTSTTTAAPAVGCIKVTNITSSGGTSECDGTPHPITLGNVAVELLDSLGNPVIATEDITVTLAFETRQCFDSAPIPFDIPVIINTGTSLTDYSYTREEVSECGVNDCQTVTDIFQSIVSISPSSYSLCPEPTTTTTTTTPALACNSYTLFAPGVSGEINSIAFINCSGVEDFATAEGYVNAIFCASSIISGDPYSLDGPCPE